MATSPVWPVRTCCASCARLRQLQLACGGEEPAPRRRCSWGIHPELKEAPSCVAIGPLVFLLGRCWPWRSLGAPAGQTAPAWILIAGLVALALAAGVAGRIVAVRRRSAVAADRA